MLQISGLNKKYPTPTGNVTALNNVSLYIRKGEFVAIIGRSGAGKSTLLNMIAGLDKPDSGSILFDGTELVGLSDSRAAILRRRSIGVIYQFYNLIPELNVSENISLPSELDGHKPDTEQLAQILRDVGLEGRDKSFPDTLSGGQQQRVAIARALFNRPSLILADEPTGNLDSENSTGVIRLLQSLNRKQGLTVIVVTHNMEIANQAGRVITIENGTIIKDRRQ